MDKIPHRYYVFTAEDMYYGEARALSKMYEILFINLKKLVALAIDLSLNNLSFLWKLLQKFIRR